MGHDQDVFFEANLVNFHHLTQKKRGCDLSKRFFMEEKAQSRHISRTKKGELVIFSPKFLYVTSMWECLKKILLFFSLTSSQIWLNPLQMIAHPPASQN
jgi:hypothetical protein